MSLLNLNYRDNFLSSVEQEMNKVFDNFFSQGQNSVKSKSGFPKLDVFETESVYQIVVCIPGVNPDEIRIELILADTFNGITSNQRILRISGKMSTKYQIPESAVFAKKELSRQKFIREWLLPENVAGNPKAEYEFGMLRLTWTKERVLTKVEPKLIPIAKA